MKADAYSDELKNSLNRYEELCFRKDLTEDERAERAEIRIRFKNISSELSGAAKERFEDIERRGKPMIKIERKETEKNRTGDCRSAKS